MQLLLITIGSIIVFIILYGVFNLFETVFDASVLIWCTLSFTKNSKSSILWPGLQINYMYMVYNTVFTPNTKNQQLYNTIIKCACILYFMNFITNNNNKHHKMTLILMFNLLVI